MKNMIKEFCLRGFMCGGFGPIVYGIVMFILYLTGVDTNIDGLILFKGIIATYMMAFIIAGISIIWKEERLGLAVAILIHSVCLYICYLITYGINGWIELDFFSIFNFTIIFVLGYLLIWVFIYLFEKRKIKNLNKNIKHNI